MQRRNRSSLNELPCCFVRSGKIRKPMRLTFLALFLASVSLVLLLTSCNMQLSSCWIWRDTAKKFPLFQEETGLGVHDKFRIKSGNSRYFKTGGRAHIPEDQMKRRVSSRVAALSKLRQQQAELARYNYGFLKNPGLFDKRNYPFDNIQELRKSVLKRLCDSLDETNVYGPDQPEPPGHLLVDDVHDLIFCQVRKVASITWRKVLDEAVAGAGGKRLRRLSSYTEMERAIRLRHYTKVMFVREPIFRAVSGWLDKFISPNGRDRQEYLIRYGCDMARRQNKNVSMIKACRFVDNVGNDHDHGAASVDDDTLYEDGGQPFSEEELSKLLPSFEDFARYLINGPVALRSDMHWESYHSRCQPCIVNYDYVGHYETLSLDADEIIRRLDLGNGATSSFPRKESASEGIAREVLGDADSLLLMRLYELYDLDCQLFGYSFQRMEQLVSASDR